MTTALLIVHLFVTLALIGVVLIQRSEGGGLGIGTSQGMGGFMSGRGTTNLLTRTTAILGTAFFALSLALALLNRGAVGAGRAVAALTIPRRVLPPRRLPRRRLLRPAAPRSRRIKGVVAAGQQCRGRGCCRSPHPVYQGRP